MFLIQLWTFYVSVRINIILIWTEEQYANRYFIIKQLPSTSTMVISINYDSVANDNTNDATTPHSERSGISKEHDADDVVIQIKDESEMPNDITCSR
jgi:hypothetical protein